MRFVYYNHSYIQEIPETPVSEKLSFSDIQKSFHMYGNEKAFFASYITDFDVQVPTQWWFTIKDNEYDLSKIPSKKRYEITKAHKFCKTEELKPLDKIHELFDVYKESFNAYPERYRPKEILFEAFYEYISSLVNDGKHEFFATYFIESGKLCGFLIITHRGKFIGLQQQKTIPAYEKYNCNAALIDFVLTKYNEQLKNGNVVFTNGSRSIKHETNFNAYLEKYFGFRKAYANLSIVYRFPFGLIVKLFKPFRFIFAKTSNSFLYNFYCVLKMDSFVNK